MLNFFLIVGHNKNHIPNYLLNLYCKNDSKLLKELRVAALATAKEAKEKA